MSQIWYTLALYYIIFANIRENDKFGETDRIMAPEKRYQSPADKVFSYFISEGGKVCDAFPKYSQDYL